MKEQTTERIENELEVKAYLQNLRYALDHGAQINFQVCRRVDEQRARAYTNRYTVNVLFPDENPADALRRELKLLTVEEYIKTVADLRFPNRSEMREFGKIYNGKDDVYIKIRVELLGQYGNAVTFVMSFHFVERAFSPEIFPYKRNQGDVHGHEGN